MPRLTDEIRGYIGKETSLQECCDVVERGAVSRYAQAIMDIDPIYMDQDYTAKTRYKTPVAPPLFPSTMLRLAFGDPDLIQERAGDPDFDGVVGSSSFGLPPLPLKDSPAVNGGTEVELIRYASHGEPIFLRALSRHRRARDIKGLDALCELRMRFSGRRRESHPALPAGAGPQIIGPSQVNCDRVVANIHFSVARAGTFFRVIAAIDRRASRETSAAPWRSADLPAGSCNSHVRFRG